VATGLALHWAIDFGILPGPRDWWADRAAAERRFADAEGELAHLRAAAAAPEGWVALHEGASLDAWTGDPALWTAAGAEIVGTSDGSLDRNAFLATELPWDDFVLAFEFRADDAGVNSGVQYRSRWHDRKRFTLAGPQADIHFGAFAGALVEEEGRWVLAWPGERAHLDAQGGRVVVAQTAPPEARERALRVGAWNAYVVIAHGPRMVHVINDVVFADVLDDEGSAVGGRLVALQLHTGAPMRIRFRALRAKSLAP
jgi:hypothetical protein